MTRIRISKYLADCGLGSRRKCEKLVEEGNVKVDGATIEELSYKVGPGQKVECFDQEVRPQPRMVIALNKPVGYLCTVSDDFNRKKVTDLIKKDVRLYPAGRLDYYSRGLLIMTNDGGLAYKLTHPKFGVPKTYKLKISGPLKDEDIKKLREGIKIDGAGVNITFLKLLKTTPHHSSVTVEIVEGRKRILRRLFRGLGYKVIDLQRVKIGNFKLKNLKEGQHMVLGDNQIKELTGGI